MSDGATPGGRGAAADVALPRHLYVHVPVCRSKCAYCDFFSIAGEPERYPDIVTATTLAALAWQRRGMAIAPLDTLYIGGGTPTMLGQYLCVLLSELRSAYPLADGAEVTVEANPDSFDPRLARDVRDAGVTRVSIGVQSLDDAALRWLGRPHDATAAIDAILQAVALGLDVSVDLICGVPGVSRAMWRASLEAVVECGAHHVSVYPLSVEDDTPLASEVASGARTVCDDDAVADEMLEAASVLASLGLERYETANYAVPGHESRHNTAYWTGEPYLGIGGGAHGMLDRVQAQRAGLAGDDPDLGRVRYACAREVVPARAATFEFVERLTVAESAREDAMLGLRLSRGITDELAARAEVTGELKRLAADGFVAHDAGRWRTTERGWLLGNEVFGRIWEPRA